MNLTTDLVTSLLEESPSFRQWAAEQLAKTGISLGIRQTVLGYLVANSSNKIQCIKYIRASWKGEEIQLAFPEYEVYLEPGRIELRAAKEFVEHYFKKIT